MDLHELCSEYGNAPVAAVMGMTERCLTDIRRGYTAMTIDDFFELEQAYPLFNMLKTVHRIGLVREERGVSRKFRRGRRRRMPNDKR